MHEFQGAKLSGPQALTVSTLHTESTPQLYVWFIFMYGCIFFFEGSRKIKVALSIVSLSVVCDLPG